MATENQHAAEHNHEHEHRHGHGHEHQHGQEEHQNENGDRDDNHDPNDIDTDQQGGEFQFLLATHKSTDILTLNTAQAMLPLDFPSIETLDLCEIKTENDMIDVVKSHRYERQARVVILIRLLGRGVPGFHHLLQYASKHNHDLVVVSGVPGSLEPDLTAMCTVSTETISQVICYFNADGCSRNMTHLFRYLADHLLQHGFGYDAPTGQPDHGLYHPRYMGTKDCDRETTMASYLRKCAASDKPTVAVIFYRCHFLSGNTSFVDALIDELEALEVNGIGLFTETLRAHENHENVNGIAVEKFPTALKFLLDETTGASSVDVVISTMAFAMGEVNPDGPTLGSWATDAVQALGCPVLQAVNSFGTKAEWEESARGLSPLDTAMNVAIPEFDGRIITVPVSFKAPQDETNKVHYYEPVPDRVEVVAKQAAKWANLAHKPNKDKKVVFMLTNSSGKAQRIGDAVGLDSPASIMELFQAMQADGYDLGDDLPANGDKLILDLVDRCSYDEIFLTEDQLANAAGHVHASVYQPMFEGLPQKQKDHMVEQWGQAPGKAYVHENSIALAGLEFGNVFVALQPPRGYGMDPDKIYHTPDLPPPHNYYALYKWLRDEWKADAIVHMGKHGTLEWLPGKGVGLSRDCYPDTFLDDMPLIYPFIINDPGEGTQSKRRAHALIIDHLTPPMTTADGYGELAQLMQLVDEYYQIEMLDPTKMPYIQKQIWELIQKINLDDDLSLLLKRPRDDDDDEHSHHGSSGEKDHHGHYHQESNNEANDHNDGHDHDQDHDHSHVHEEEKECHHGHASHSHEHNGENEEKDHDHSHHSHTSSLNKKKEHAHGHESEKHGHDDHDDDHHGHSHSNHAHHKDENDNTEDHSHAHAHEENHGHNDAVEEHDDHGHDHDHEHFHELTQDSLAKMDGKDFAHLIEDMDGYLCELAGAQIRDGLHILGQVPPQGDSMVDMLQALTRLPNLEIPSLREAIASMFELDSTELLSNQGARIKDLPPMLIRLADRPLATAGDAVESIDELAKHMLALLDQENFDAETIPSTIGQTFPGLSAEVSKVSEVLNFVCKTLVPSLRGTTQEITHLLDALNGKFVPAGPSGSPTRGMAHLLPTGRNFYACDPQALPSLAAWEVGQGLAKEVSNRYLIETGAYPEHVAISVWGTAAMRTHGDDIAQIFALLGVRPIWQQENHRVTGVELIPLSELRRPRIDVTVRISGFFRDAFPHLIILLDEAVNLAINADEPLEQNYIRKHFLEDMEKGEMKEESARYRIFGCPPGAYGKSDLSYFCQRCAVFNRYVNETNFLFPSISTLISKIAKGLEFSI